MTLAGLLVLIPPPVQVVAERSWDEVADEFGVTFAPGYRDVVTTYGKGRFDQGTILFDPRRREFDDRARALSAIMADPELRAEPLPHPPYPGDGPRLLPVTSNGSGGYIMTVVMDGEQEESEFWLADLDADEFERVDGPFANVLVRLARRSATEVDDVWQFAAPFKPL
jgi:hypothetical protein